jgi:hypothetical protein
MEPQAVEKRKRRRAKKGKEIDSNWLETLEIFVPHLKSFKIYSCNLL